MSVFDDITLTWKGESYTIPSDRVMGAIARIEDRITLVELERAGWNVPLSKISQGYGTALRYAGCRVTDDEVYAAMFEDSDTVSTAKQAIDTLLMLMMPPKIRGGGAATTGPTKAPAKATGKSTPKQRTK